MSLQIFYNNTSLVLPCFLEKEETGFRLYAVTYKNFNEKEQTHIDIGMIGQEQGKAILNCPTSWMHQTVHIAVCRYLETLAKELNKVPTWEDIVNSIKEQ